MLACAPLGNSNPGYPSGKLAQFVVEKLDVTTLPQEHRPGQAKGKKTLEQYCFVPVAITESEAVLRNAAGPSEIVIRVLEQRASGIYVCARHRQKRRSKCRLPTCTPARAERCKRPSEGQRILPGICELPRHRWRRRLTDTHELTKKANNCEPGQKIATWPNNLAGLRIWPK